MISKMAMADIEALRADGIDVPPREVVRLNALGLRVERGPESADLFAPSLGAEMWLRQALDAFDGDDEQTYFTLRVLSCVVPWRELPDPAGQNAVRKAIKTTLKRLSDATIRQLDNALEWCIGGNLPETGEKPPPRPAAADSSAADAEDMPERYSPEFGLFYRGMAVRIGTAADMKDMTMSAMLAVCDRAETIAATSTLGGGHDRKAEKNTATGDYYRALDAVRAQETA